MENKKNQETLLSFEAFVPVGEHEAYASSDIFNGLFRVDMETGNCTYLRSFPGENRNKERLHTKAVFTKNRIYFIPCSADGIDVYELDSREISRIPIRAVDKKKYSFYRPAHKFADAILYESWIYLICATYPAVIGLHVETGKLEYFNNWVPEEGFFFRKGVFAEKNTFYVPSANNNFVLQFDMQTQEGKLFRVGQHNQGCWSICRCGTDYWLAPKKPGAVLKWKPLTNEVTEYDNYPPGFCDNGFAFTKIYPYQDKVYLIPAHANMSLSVSILDGSMENGRLFEVEDKMQVGFMFTLGQKYYLMCVPEKGARTLERKYICLDISDNRTYPYAFRFTEGRKALGKELIEQQESDEIKESNVFGLEDLIETLADDTGQDKKEEWSIGALIYKEICKETD